MEVCFLKMGVCFSKICSPSPRAVIVRFTKWRILWNCPVNTDSVVQRIRGVSSEFTRTTGVYGGKTASEHTMLSKSKRDALKPLWRSILNRRKSHLAPCCLLDQVIKGATTRTFCCMMAKTAKYLTRNFFSNMKLLLEHGQENMK